MLEGEDEIVERDLAYKGGWWIEGETGLYKSVGGR